MSEGRITDRRPYADHVPVVCKECGFEARTKNIAPIGCRNIFPNGVSDEQIEMSRVDDLLVYKFQDVDVPGYKEPVPCVCIPREFKASTVELIAKHWKSASCSHVFVLNLEEVASDA